MTSDAQAILVAIILVVLIVVAIVVVAARHRRSQLLRERFGPEYDRTVRASGDRRSAEHELSARERRREGLDIRPLTDTQRDRYVRDWKATQAKFVDDPRSALAQADALLREVMEARGYPTGDFQQQAADLSVDYAEVVNDYRRAHAIVANSSRASTEDMRSAMVLYRSLFDRLVAERTVREPVSQRI
jgi:hypothetical protein